jgi:hypothetical protein
MLSSCVIFLVQLLSCGLLFPSTFLRGMTKTMRDCVGIAGAPEEFRKENLVFSTSFPTLTFSFLLLLLQLQNLVFLASVYYIIFYSLSTFLPLFPFNILILFYISPFSNSLSTTFNIIPLILFGGQSRKPKIRLQESVALTTQHPLSSKFSTNFKGKRWSLGLADWGHGVGFVPF